MHSRHHPRLGAPASELGQRRDGWICDFSSPLNASDAVLSMGYYTPRRPALLLCLSGFVHHLRQLFLFRDGPHRSQSSVYDGGFHRSRRQKWRTIARVSGAQSSIVLSKTETEPVVVRNMYRLVERDPRVELPQRIARIARCQSACDRQRLVIARGRSPGIAGLQFGVAKLIQYDGHIPQPERIVRVVFGQPLDIC